MLKLHESRVSRKGKGAKGTVKVRSFGVPALNSDGIAKNFVGYADIVLAHDLQWAAINAREALKGFDIDMSDSQLAADLLSAIDVRLRSQNAKEQSENALLGNKLFGLGLVTDRKEGETVAKKLLENARNTFVVASAIEQFNTLEKCIDAQIDVRRKAVIDLKSKGQWAIAAPIVGKLVDNRQQPAEIEESDSDEDELDLGDEVQE